MLLAAAEAVVRLTGAADRCSNAAVQPYIWVCDPLLGFKTRPSLEIDGQPMNRAGFRGPDYDSHAAFRVVTLGDSTTFGYVETVDPMLKHPFVHQPYPERLAELLQARLGNGNVSVLNAGECGYNTWHAVRLLKTKLQSLRPTVLTIKYGWNDLLLSADGMTGTYRRPQSWLGDAAETLELHTALYPLALRLRIELRPASVEAMVARSEWTPNVPPDEFTANLRTLVDLGRRRGARVLLLTSADAFMSDAFANEEAAYAQTSAKQAYFKSLGGIRSFAELHELRERYNAIIRTVGAETGTPIVDLATVYLGKAGHYFTAIDAIHPTDEGHALEARALAHAIMR